METPDTIHAFWFGTTAHEDDEATIIARQSALWWKKEPEVDAEIRRRFAPLSKPFRLLPCAAGPTWGSRLVPWRHHPSASSSIASVRSSNACATPDRVRPRLRGMPRVARSASAKTAASGNRWLKPGAGDATRAP